MKRRSLLYSKDFIIRYSNLRCHITLKWAVTKLSLSEIKLIQYYLALEKTYLYHTDVTRIEGIVGRSKVYKVERIVSSCPHLWDWINFELIH